LFETLVALEALLCAALAGRAVQVLAEIAPAPELELGQRAWVAARYGMAEASALGPLFRHLVRATRGGLQQAHQIQEQIRSERARREALGALAPLIALWQRRQNQRSPELADLSHLVEQLEQMSVAVARYRAGTGRLMEVQVPLSCVHAQIRSAARAANASDDMRC
jgi:hypothetical protein